MVVGLQLVPQEGQLPAPVMYGELGWQKLVVASLLHGVVVT